MLFHAAVHVSHLPGFRLRRARHDAKLSQAQLADALGVPVRMVRDWELGREPADVLVLHAVAVVTGCSRDALLGRLGHDDPTRSTAH